MFNDVYLIERHEHMIKEILSLKDVDVICFQEVLYEAAQYFIKNLKNSFFPVFEKIQLEEMSYGVMIFVRNGLTVQNKAVTKIPTEMGRSLLHAEILKNDVKYNIATFHLESLNSTDTRKTQFDILMKTYDKLPNVIMCGDTNIKNDEKYVLSSNLSDAALVSGNEISTYWGCRFWNSNTHYRYDRVYYSNNLVLGKYSRIFDEPSENTFRWISDHDGIVTTFRPR
jgi:endonuclease/exonuclease/phosphatase family metal-dependent hydrolase